MTALDAPAPAGTGRGPGGGPGRRAVRLWLAGWPAVVQLVLDLVLAVPYLVVSVLFVVGVALVPVFGVGILLLVAVLALARACAAFERARLRAFGGASCRRRCRRPPTSRYGGACCSTAVTGRPSPTSSP